MLRLGQEVMIFDGAMGSELEKLGFFGAPEELNATHPEIIRNIHRSYTFADFIMTNTFGLNSVKYKGKYSISELALKAIENARAAGRYVIYDIGPTGAMLEPLGTLTFDRAYEAFAEIAEITKDLVDGYIAETFSDLYEMKACVLALKEHTSKPVFATMTFDNSGRTLTGSTPEIVANTLEGLGVDALGVNCSSGPKELFGIVKRLVKSSGVPVVVQPNRGLPKYRDGKTYYDLSVDEFEFYMQKFIDEGVSVLGGCCGTTPEFIQRIAKFKGLKVNRPPVSGRTQINSATKIVDIDGVKICGERLNPTGKKKLKEALLSGDSDYLIDEAVKQAEAGADLLDVNVGLPQLDEKTVMPEVVKKIQEYVDLPLQIDSSSPEAIERGVRYYNGIPVINSVNGENEVMDKIFPIAKKYGAVVIGLTMDKKGVPATAKERVKIARRIISRARKYGIPRHKLIIDTLVLTASAEQKLVKETVEALYLVRKLGVKCALGVSNVSYGLPNRGLLNKTFLAVAMANGLNMPIMNPLDGEMTGAVKAFKVLSGEDENSENYIEIYKDFAGAQIAANIPKVKDIAVSNLYECILRGSKNTAESLTKRELETKPPLDIVNDIVIKALDEVGRLYDCGKLFLPQLVSAAEAAKIAFAEIGTRLPKGGNGKGKIILATVYGDVHDIGKNIVKVVSESYGYDVIDLGKDTPVQAVVDAYLKHMPGVIGLSALMTTTVSNMEQTIKALRKVGCKSKIFVGGAVLNEEIAKKIGADYYTKDALGFIKTVESL